MYVEYHISETPSNNTTLSVYEIYRLLADHTYHVNHSTGQSGQMIFVYTDQGTGKLTCSEGEFILAANTALIFSTDTPFVYETLGSHWHFWWFDFSGITPASKGHLYTLRKNDLLETICKNALNAHRIGDSNAAAYLSCLLALCADSEQSAVKPDQEIFSRAQATIKRNLYRTNICDLAKELYVDPRTLYNLFQRYGGCSPKVYIRNYVMDMASYLLQNTTKSIGEIGEEIGFANQFHFSRVFKETYGISPRTFRNR